MVSLSGVLAGRAFVELFADDRRLIKGLNAASRQLQAWGQSVTAIGQQLMTAGMVAVGGLLGSTKVFASMGDTIAKASERTGIGVERLSELAYAAEKSGTDLATLEGGIRKMQKTLAEAAGGSASAQRALANLGLSVSHLMGLSPDQQFTLIADRLARINDSARRAAAAMELFGRSGTQLLPMIANGAAGLEAFAQRARAFGLVITTEDARAAVEFSDLLSDLWKTVKMGIFVLGSSLTPVITKFVQTALGAVKGIADWIRANQELIITILKVAAAAVAAGAMLIALGKALSLLGFIFGTVASIITGIGTALSLLSAIIGALLSPITLVVAALTALGGYFLYTSGAGQRALSELGQHFTSLKDTALAAWQGIAAALASGDIGLAANILWLTLKLEWQKGIAWLKKKWSDFQWFFKAVAIEAVYGLARNLASAWAEIQRIWVNITSALSQAWSTFTYFVSTAWRTVQHWLGAQFIKIRSMFDTSFDAKVALRLLDENFEKEQRKRDQAFQKELRDIKTTQQAEIQKIDTLERGTLRTLEKEREREYESLQRQSEAELKATEAQLNETRRMWRASLRQAAEKRPITPETLRAAQEVSMSEVKHIETEWMRDRTFSVTGTFNPFAAVQLGTGGPIERAARAAEKVAENTDELARLARQGGLVFG